jgi:acetyl-CoA acetyltransferase
VFVDGVRTPFGKAGPKGMYAETRADDLVVRCIRELLRRNPGLPPERVDDVAIAATTQIGDQGLTIGRTAALLAGLPKTVPGYAIDRMCAGAMTAVTTAASASRSARTTSWWPEASSTWGTIRWARASTRTPGSSPSASSIPPPW